MFGKKNGKKEGYKILDEFSRAPTICIGMSVIDLDETIDFYTENLGCKLLSRNSDSIEMDFFGHEVAFFCAATIKEYQSVRKVEESQLSVPYFGLTVSWEDWHKAVTHLNYVGTSFKIDPEILFPDTNEERGNFVLVDPSDNNLKFSAYRYGRDS